MNSSPRPYLKVARLQSTQRGMRSTSSCSTLTHSTGPMPSGKSKTSGSLNGGVVNHRRRRRPLLLTDHRRVEALLDRGPDRERRREDSLPSSSVTTRLAPSRVPSSSISENRWSAAYRANTSESPGSTPMPTSASRPASLPVAGLGELLVAELHADLLVRRLGVRAATATSPCRGSRRPPRTPRRRAASRTRGSTAFITCVIPCSRHSARHRAGVGGVDLGADEPVVDRGGPCRPSPRRSRR